MDVSGDGQIVEEDEHDEDNEDEEPEDESEEEKDDEPEEHRRTGTFGLGGR